MSLNSEVVALSTIVHSGQPTTDDYSTQEVTLSKIVTESMVEKAIICFYYTLCVIYVPCTNGLIIHVVRKTPALQTPQYFFITCYAMCDLLYSLTTHYMVLPALIWDLTEIPEWLCRLEGTISAGIFFTTSHVLGLIAYERYYCFFKPLHYGAYFNLNRLRLLAIMPHVFGQGFSLFIELYVGRHYFTTILVCNASGPDLVYLNPAVIFLFYLPSAFMSIICLVILIILVKRQHNSVVPSDSMTPHFKKTLSINKAVKIVLLVSGTFWATSVPAFIGRTVIFSSGATWNDMDTRSNSTAYVISRTFNFMFMTMSALINPIIYLTINKELRKSCRNMFCRQCKGQHQEEIPHPTNSETGQPIS